MYTTATRPASVSTSRRTPTFDAYSRYKALALGRANHSQPKLTSVKTALPAEIGSTAYTYSYTAQNSACTGKPGIPAGTDLSNAGKSSNRTSQTITNPSVNGGSAVSTYHCYDQADRLVYSSDPTVGVPEYDSHGNTTKLGAGSSTQLELTYDSSDRNSQILQINPSTAAGTAIQYNRDVQGRLTKRRSFTITNWNW
ncbi:hypothetical protein JNM87_06725, partial [Candidatus Saccharibacteria bacterium]|nr:hypothetical protein [Candidatus Saccharibacteria bacterium]